MKTLVLYVYNSYNTRVDYFIKNGIFLDPDIDFMIMNTGDDDVPVVPDYVIYIKGSSIGYEFGGWSRGLLLNNLYKEYDNYILVNSSAMGPYLPSYFKGKWTDIYLDGLTNITKLFGSTINANMNDPENASYVQSYIFSLSKDALEYLISKDIFSLTNNSNSLNDVMINKEMKMSRYIIENGWNIGCLMTYYKGVDFRFLTMNPSEYKPFLGDVMNIKQFSDKLFNNFYELVFIKGSRFDFNVNGIKL